jgi:hypothetical protein
MTRSKIPTLLAIFILILSGGLILFAVGQVRNFASIAEGNQNVVDIKITNIKDTQAVVSWLTDTPSVGFIKYVSENGQSSEVSSGSRSITHFFMLQNLSPNTKYTLYINNSTNSRQFQTLNNSLPERGSLVSGQVLDKNNFPAKNAIVYITVGQNTFSTLVSASGNWVVSLPSLGDTTELNILVQEKPNEEASAKINLKDANPVPSITIGHSYDFTTAKTEKTIETPAVPIELP